MHSSYLFLSSGSPVRRTSIEIVRRSSTATHWWSIRRLPYGLCHFPRLCALLSQRHVTIILILGYRGLIKDLTGHWVRSTVIMHIYVVCLRFRCSILVLLHNCFVNGVCIRVVTTIWSDLDVHAFSGNLLRSLRMSCHLGLSPTSIHRLVHFWIVKHL